MAASNIVVDKHSPDEFDKLSLPENLGDTSEIHSSLWTETNWACWDFQYVWCRRKWDHFAKRAIACSWKNGNRVLEKRDTCIVEDIRYGLKRWYRSKWVLPSVKQRRIGF